MKLIFHHLLKDVRAQRWLLLVWALILLAEFLLNQLALQPDFFLARTADKFFDYPFLFILGMMTKTLLLIRLVQSEPVTGSTSFWLTRPIPTLVSVPGKLIFLLLFLALPGLVPDLIDRVQFQVDGASIRESIQSDLLADAMFGLCILWLATFTRNLIHFFAATAFIILGFGFLIFILPLMGMKPMGANPPPHAYDLSNTRSALFSFLFLPGLLLSLVIQYSRINRLGLRVGVTTTALAFAAFLLWPVPLPFLLDSDQETASPKMTQVDFSPDWQKSLFWSEPSSRSDLTAAYALLTPIQTSGPSYPVMQTLAAGFQVPGQPPDNLTPDTHYLQGIEQVDWVAKIAEALPQFSLDPAFRPKGFIWRASAYQLFGLDPILKARLAGQTGTLVLKISGNMQLLEKKAEIPLHQAFAREPGQLIRVRAELGEKPDLLVWTVGYRGGWDSCDTPDRYFILADPVTLTGTILRPTQSGTRSDFSSTEKNSTEEKLSLNGKEPLDRMVLYIYGVELGDKFESTVTTPDFTMNIK